MTLSRVTLFGVLLVCASCVAQQAVEAPLTAEAIMARVAANQDRTDAERSHYVYLQHARVLSRKGKTVMCEEVTDSRVTPSGSASRVELMSLKGRLLRKHAYVEYTALAASQGKEDKGQHGVSIDTGDDEMDRSLVEQMRSTLINDDSKDGVGAGLFPLTSKGQRDYAFQLVGRERMNGREVFHIGFHPRDNGEPSWKGDAYIDTQAFQPVVVRTMLAHNIPTAVRLLLGTSVPGLGFTVVYAPQADGIWFPASFGTEFKVRVLFFFSRQIVVAAQNREFEKTHVASHIVDAGQPAQLY